SASKPEKCDVIKHVIKVNADDADKTSQALDAPTVPAGCIGIWEKSLQPGKNYLNPDAYSITMIDTRAQVWTYAGGYTRSRIDLTVNAKGDIEQKRTEEAIPVNPDNADRAVFVKME